MAVWFGGDFMAARQQRKYTDEGALRFAALWAGCDAGNPNDDEACGKFRALRRMAFAEGLRIIDAFELPEIREAVDRQLKPDRAPVKVVREVKFVNEGCKCEPWPLQMFWFFVGVVAWIVTLIFRGLTLPWMIVKAWWRGDL